MCKWARELLEATVKAESKTNKPEYIIIKDSSRGMAHDWDGEAWLDEKWESDKAALERGETPRRWFW